MAKGDVWYLRDKSNNYIVAKIEFTDNYCTGVCYEPYSWNQDGTPFECYYVASFYCKWDSCTHWNFNGEDYDEEFPKSHDSYYHLCGTHRFMSHIRSMCFVWKVASNVLSEWHKKDDQLFDMTIKNYFDDETTKLIELMLDGYVIEKEEKTNE